MAQGEHPRSMQRAATRADLVHDKRGYNVEKFTAWWLSPTPLKNLTSSVGMMTFSIYGKIKAMFQTTNQFMLKESTAAGRKNSHNLRSQTITDDRTEISPLKSCSATNVLEKINMLSNTNTVT